MNRTPLRHGSITQWISICNCLSESGANEEIAQVEVCSSCGKKLTKGRDGSFTQWVFRHDLCHCEHQRPDLPLRIDRQNSTISDHIESESEAILREDEQGLNMPEGSFPVERYLPRKELGRGATGSVYLCRDRMLAKDVAVKILNKVTAFELVSFQMEARATSKLDHVNIVKMFDFGATESGVPFMVMDYLDGSNLQEYIVVNGPLSVSQAVSVFSQACLAFDYAHKQGLYHRDIQTRNLMIRKDSSADLQVKVIDFGIASRKMDETETIQIESRADGSGEALVGTPYYMAPDQ
ncbi:MAG: serine/threonine protein kinase, partial [Candidatus Obscuribacterales bacterium]|nr:serine/threonine protein kinase [Candidatus Obscuribacterales bacterium]